MATIKQMFELMDGVSPVLNVISRTVDKTIGKFDRAAKAASGIELAAEQGGEGIRRMVECATSSVHLLGDQVVGLGGKLRSLGSELRAGISGMVGQFALATIAANAFMSALSYISGLPERLTRASDAYAGIQVRLRMVAGGAQQAAELNDLIYASAQRARGSYEEMADSVSKIAMTAKKAFPDARDVVPFMEGIQKLFVIGGTGVEQQKNALLQMTQALGSGKLQGDEFRSIAEAAPLIEQMVAKYMQIDPGQLKAISSEGKITADILRNSILTNLDMINEQFETMPRTWAQNMQVIENTGQRAFAPVFAEINALYACPLTWMIGLVVALVAAFYLGVAAINHFAGTSLSATGIIFAAFAWLFTGIVNYLKFVVNMFIAYANFLGSVFQDPLGAIYNLFVDIWNGVSEYVGAAVNGIIDMINAIPGMDKIRTFDHVEVPALERKEIVNAAFHIDPLTYGNAAYNAEQAYDFGANMTFPGLPEGLMPSAAPYVPGNAMPYDGSEDLGKSGRETADNTGAIKEAMEISDEDLKYLREAAEQEAINQYTTATVQIDMGGVSNNISNGMDLDGVMTFMTDGLLEAMAAGAEAVHPT